jgi:N-acyl-D-amino-acid deacylase
MKSTFLAFFLSSLIGCAAPPEYDVIIRNGMIYDGSGRPPVTGDVAIAGDRLAAIGDVGRATAPIDIDAEGLAVAPGFVNMLSWATDDLVADGRSQGDIRQGVTLEVFGEGWSEGPLNEEMKRVVKKGQGDIKFDIEWTTLGDYMEFLERKGISTNVASFVGATTVRMHELGEENRAPTEDELERMEGLVRQAMEEGALGVGSSPPPSTRRRKSSSSSRRSRPNTTECTSPTCGARGTA